MDVTLPAEDATGFTFDGGDGGGDGTRARFATGGRGMRGKRSWMGADNPGAGLVPATRISDGILVAGAPVRREPCRRMPGMAGRRSWIPSFGAPGSVGSCRSLADRLRPPSTPDAGPPDGANGSTRLLEALARRRNAVAPRAARLIPAKVIRSWMPPSNGTGAGAGLGTAPTLVELRVERPIWRAPAFGAGAAKAAVKSPPADMLD